MPQYSGWTHESIPLERGWTGDKWKNTEQHGAQTDIALALGVEKPDGILWFWIESRSKYDALLA